MSDDKEELRRLLIEIEKVAMEHGWILDGATLLKPMPTGGQIRISYSRSGE